MARTETRPTRADFRAFTGAVSLKLVSAAGGRIARGVLPRLHRRGLIEASLGIVCRHRAIGKMKIVNIPIPAFDPHDEWFD